MRLTACLLCLALPAAAQDVAECPPVPDHGARKTELLRDLRLSRDATDAAQISDGLWDIWTDAPNERAQLLLDTGMEALRRHDFATSRSVLGELTAYCPDFAEGWNQRAFAAYLSGDHASALADLDRALEIEPQHVPALAGKALTLMQLDRDAEAQLVLRDALHLNPWLSERALLTIPLGTEL